MKPITEIQLGNGDYTHKHTFYFVQLVDGQRVQDILDPTFWGQLEKQRKLRANDIIRLRAHDGSWDMAVTVKETMRGGANVELWPRLPEGVADLFLNKTLRCAPLDHLGNSVIRAFSVGDKWRVNGLEHQQVSEHGSQPEANGAMQAYLAQVRMRLPTAEESAAHREAVELKEAETAAALADKKAALAAKMEANKKRAAAQKRHEMSA